MRDRSLRTRLFVAFMAVAAAALAAFAVLTLVTAHGDVAQLVRRQQQTAVANTARAAADAYTAAGSWAGADLRPARAVAVSAGAVLEVRDTQGAATAGPGLRGMGSGMGQMRQMHVTGPVRRSAVLVDGRPVGSVTLRFLSDALPPAEARLQDALARSVVYGLLVALAVALVAGYVVSAGITRPLEQLTRAVRRIGGGDRQARANVDAPGELGVLASEVDAMADRLEREDELRRALTADVAHELRTPVSILTAHCEAILDGVEEPTRDLTMSLYDEVIRLGNLIEDVETLAAAEAAGLRMERQPVRFDRIVGSAVAVLRPQAEAAEVTLRARLTPDCHVAGDAMRLGQVARNLIINAIKFTPPGGSIDVALAREADGVVLTVSDSGIGIPPDELPHVFERFWRGGGSRGTGGSGIGLAVVHELVRAHGGTVEISSEVAKGSAFTVSFPALRAAASSTADLAR